MVWLRVFLCPIILVGAYYDWAGAWLAAIVLLALVDDIYDGILARRWKCDTPQLRRADSRADTIFYLGVAGVLWIRHPEVLLHNLSLLIMLICTELAGYGLGFWKFGKAPSYHSYLAKAWGLVMAAAVISVLCIGGPQWLICMSLLMGIFANGEGIAISIVLPQWRHDVKTFKTALKMRWEMTK